MCLSFRIFGGATRRTAARGKCGLVISSAVGFQQLQHLIKLGSDFAEVEFRFHVEHGIEIRFGEAGARECVEFGSQLRDVG